MNRVEIELYSEKGNSLYGVEMDDLLLDSKKDWMMIEMRTVGVREG